MVKKFLVLILFFFGVLGSAYGANLIQTRIHDDKIFQGESFLFIITATGRFEQNDLDPRPLAKDFTLGETSFTYDANNDRSIWRIPMICRRDGIQMIPSFLIKDNVSTPFPITVRRAHSLSSRPEISNLVVTELKSRDFYVNETILIKTVINKTPKIDISSINAPVLEGNGQIHLVHEDTKQKNTMGRSSTTITRIYAASFREPGVHRIYPVMVNGTYLQKDTNVTISNHNQNNAIVVYDPARNQGAARKIRFVQQAEPFVINISPVKGQKNPLIASDLKIREKWEPEKDATLGVNEPIAHEISFTAQGVSVADLPHPLVKDTPQYKAYNDRLQTWENYDPQTGILTSSLTIRQVYVPLKSMTLRFEPLEISWLKRGTEGKASISIYRLTSPSYTIIGSGNESYDLRNTSLTQTLLMSALILIIFLIGLCVFYLLYLERIITFDYLKNRIARYRARRDLLKNFSTDNARKAYQQIMTYARICCGPNCNSFEKIPGYEKYRTYLDAISEALWNTDKTATGADYDGREFRKILSKFTKLQ
ncbi:MAG: hypothetical protein ACI4VX_07865 [Succinivibrionaceae bacterium]